MLSAAATIAAKLTAFDRRTYLLGAIGIRNDDVLVTSKNIAATSLVPGHHAEARLARKLTPGSTVWVARVRPGGMWAIAKPCAGCELRLRAAGVSRVVYTIAPNEWGVIDLKECKR